MVEPGQTGRAAVGLRAAAVLSGLLVLAFFDVVFLGRTLQVSRTIATTYPSGPYAAVGPPPASIPITDNTPGVLEEPYLAFKRHELAAGRLPLWNPYQATGMPFAANPEATLFFPPDLLLHALPPAYAWDVFLLLRLLAAGLFTALFLRTAGCGEIAAVGGALCYMLGGPIVTWLNNVTVNSDCLLPLLLYALEQVLRGERPWAVPLAAATVGFTILGGHPEHAFFVQVTGVLYLAYRMWHRAGTSGVGWRVAATYVLGFGVAGVLLVPFVQLWLRWAWTYHVDPVGLHSDVRSPDAAGLPGGAIGPALTGIVTSVQSHLFCSAILPTGLFVTLVAGLVVLAVRGLLDRPTGLVVLVMTVIYVGLQLGATALKFRGYPTLLETFEIDRYFVAVNAAIWWLVAIAVASALPRSPRAAFLATTAPLCTSAWATGHLQRPALQDLKWPRYARSIDAGLDVTAPINPPPWTVHVPSKSADDQAVAMQGGLDALYTRRDPDAAAIEFRKVLSANPRHYGATFQLAVALDAAGRPMEARPYWEQALALAQSYADRDTAERARLRLAASDVSSDEALMQQGLDALYVRHDPAAAAAEFQLVLVRDPTHYGATFQLASALDAAGQHAEARALWEKIVAMAVAANDTETAAKARARLAYNADVGTAPASPPRTPEYYLDRSLQFYQAGEFNECIAAAREALKLKPDMAEAFNNLAAGYASMRMWNEAIDAAAEAVRLHPDFQLARNNLAWAEEQRRLEESRLIGR